MKTYVGGKDMDKLADLYRRYIHLHFEIKRLEREKEELRQLILQQLNSGDYKRVGNWAVVVQEVYAPVVCPKKLKEMVDEETFYELISVQSEKARSLLPPHLFSLCVKEYKNYRRILVKKVEVKENGKKK